MRTSGVEKRDIIHLIILLSVAFCIGIYLIATTVLIAKDGVFYIEQAKKFSNNPLSITKGPPLGYPFLIFLAHKFFSLFSEGSSAYSWIYSAQSITLLCRLLALIPLYFIGKLLVGGMKSFWAVLILLTLPYSAKSVCDVVREWPYILFLSAGFLGLLVSANKPKWWIWGLVGLSAGLGYLIRHESAQLVVYGFIWLTLSMFRPKLCGVSRWKILVGLALLLIGFVIPILPHMRYTGQIIPPNAEHIMKSFSFNALPDKADVPETNTVGSNYNIAKIISSNVLKAIGEIFSTIGENLMWLFMPALAMGIYFRFRGNAKREERFLITAFILANVTMMILRYCYIQPAVSKRWSLPLITLTIFYIPVALHVIGNRIEAKLPMNKQKTSISKEKGISWYLVLLLIGIVICIPKLLRPVRIEKQGYREAAKWLMQNTAPTDFLAVPDYRIAFYAERRGVIYDKKVPKRAKYVVEIVAGKDGKPKFGKAAQEKFSAWVNRREKKKRIAIYEVL